MTSDADLAMLSLALSIVEQASQRDHTTWLWSVRLDVESCTSKYIIDLEQMKSVVMIECDGAVNDGYDDGILSDIIKVFEDGLYF